MNNQHQIVVQRDETNEILQEISPI